MMSSDFLEILRQKNSMRQAEWPADFPVDMLFRGLELAGETGELAGAVKKLYRSMNGIGGNGHDQSKYIDNIKEEMGDVLICLDLLALKLESDLNIPFDLEQVTRDKFDATSRKVNLTTMFGD